MVALTASRRSWRQPGAEFSQHLAPILLSACLSGMPVLSDVRGSREHTAAAVGAAEGAVLERSPHIAPWPEASAAALRDDGCILVRDTLSPPTVAALRAHCESELADGLAKVASGAGAEHQYFGTILARSDRHDLKLALSPVVSTALAEVLTSIAPLVRGAFLNHVEPTECDTHEEPVLAELGAIRSTQGAPRQPLHSDTRRADAPVLLTAFVALQDVEESMGPTTFLPGSHRDERAHAALGHAGQKAEFLRSCPSRLGVMPAGACTLYDSRLLHAGGANSDTRGRWLFYAGFAPSRVVMRELRGDQYEPLQRASHTLSQLERGGNGNEGDIELEAVWAALLRPRQNIF